MNDKEFDLLVLVGRFQPLHDQHKRVIDIALQKSRHVLVLVGSAGKARTIRNPFTFDERRDMITGCYENDWDVIDPEGQTERRLIIRPLYDKTYNDAAWVKQVQELVKDTTLDVMNPSGFMASGYNDAKVGLIGASKDIHTEYYLRLFPQWHSISVGIETDLHATAIREEFYEDQIVSSAAPLPGNVINWMNDFALSDECESLRREYWFVKKYKEQWSEAPYPPIFVTTDAIVECSGHILLVTRKAEPGKGMLALPGGFLNQNEKIIDGTIRELREETKIKVPEAVLRGSIIDTRVFDDPYRSARGRTITHCSLFRLNNGPLPKVKGSDDAISAKWYKFSDLSEEMLFEDHWHLIAIMTGCN
jgi:bifunctional NMN adenylyltransferase/nudix hydrolase